MAAAYPVAKLAGLAFNQSSKPIANLLLKKAQNSYFFRTSVCMPLGQSYHRFTEKLKKKIEEMEHEDNGHEWKMDTGRPVEIPKLDDQMAIEKGANFLGEVIILSIAASILVTGYVGPKKIKEAEQEKRRREKHEHLAKEIRDLHVTVKDLLKEGREKRS